MDGRAGEWCRSGRGAGSLEGVGGRQGGLRLVVETHGQRADHRWQRLVAKSSLAPTSRVHYTRRPRPLNSSPPRSPQPPSCNSTLLRQRFCSLSKLSPKIALAPLPFSAHLHFFVAHPILAASLCFAFVVTLPILDCRVTQTITKASPRTTPAHSTRNTAF